MEQATEPIPNADGTAEIMAPLSVSPVWPSPTLDTVMVCEPEAFPKPKLPVEKYAAGPAKLINGVTVTWSFTVIISLMLGSVRATVNPPVSVAGGGAPETVTTTS